MRNRDEIIEEVRRVRDKYAKSFNYDIKAICKHLREKGKSPSREVIATPTPSRSEAK